VIRRAAHPYTRVLLASRDKRGTAKTGWLETHSRHPARPGLPAAGLGV